MTAKSRMSFRTQLVLFGLLLVVIVALPSLIIEVQRPWEELANLISRGNIIVSKVKSDFDPYQLKKMNEFALHINESADPKLENYLVWTFNLWFEFCEHETCVMVLTPEYMTKILKTKGMDTKNFDFQKLLQAENFWDKQFAPDPRLRIIFKEYKGKLIQARLSAKTAKFNFADTYVMADDAKKLVFVLDGESWSKSSYPGLSYYVNKNDCPYFRDYLIKGAGYYTNPTAYHLGIFPKFDTDQWGNWFSVWLAEQTKDGSWNNFALDFDASKIRRLMWTIGIYIMTTILVTALVIALITEKLSLKISKPINFLMTAAKEVIDANYDVVVPKIGSREFEEFISIFNDMIVKLKGRVNLKRMLVRLLSKELAEKVEKDGIVLEGQEVEATIMFTDFAGFSTITHGMLPDETFGILNEYFKILDPLVYKWTGFTDKFVGDAIVAIFGAPLPLDNHAENAVCCAIEMQMKMRELNAIRKKEGKTIFEMRVGLYSGKVIAGALGSDRKIDYTSIGETTNLANRLESASEIGHILISQMTFEKIEHIFFENVDIDGSPHHFEVKGYNEPIDAYHIYVAEIEITKNQTATGKDDFYIFRTVRHDLKQKDKLADEKKQKFTKFVKITLN